MSIKISVFVLSVFFVINVYAQSSVRVLNIGDTIQNVQLKFIEDDAVKSLNILDTKKKLIILDFWAGSCGPCIQALSKLSILQSKYPDLVQIYSIPKEITSVTQWNELKRKLPRLNNQNLRTIISPTPLSGYFPYKIVSHVVWISGDGVVRAFTGTDEVTENNILEAASGKKLTWRMKYDILNISIKDQLFNFTNLVRKPKQIFHSSLTSYIEGINLPSGVPVIDSVSETKTITYYNTSLLNLCMYAKGIYDRNQFKLSVKDTSLFIRPDFIPRNDWNISNLYTYSITFPKYINLDEIKMFIQRDLINRLAFLGFEIVDEVSLIDDKKVIMYKIISNRTEL